MSSKIVAVIPAKEESVRFPGKNKRKLCGKPLFAWAVELALEIRMIDKVIVSSDDPEILEECLLLYGNHEKLEVMRRSKEFAQPDTPLWKVIEHIWISGGLDDRYIVVLLQPTSPLRDASDINNAINMFLKTGEGVVPITKVNKFYYKRCGTVFVDRYYKIVPNEGMREGQFILIPKERALDIDLLVEFKRAESLMKKRLE